MKLKAQIQKWQSGVYSVYMSIGVRGGLETGNYKSKSYAKRAFRAMCRQVGIPDEKWEFEEIV